MRRLALAALVSACGDPGPCEDAAGACVVLRVSSDTVDAIDQLELDLLYNGVHARPSSSPSGGGLEGLPLLVGIELAVDGAIDIGIVGSGKRSGVVLGTGAVRAQLEPKQRAELAIALGPTSDCKPNRFYCGGSRIAGDPQTLYKCSAAGPPIARAVCEVDCFEADAGADDGCVGIGGRCVDGGKYCGSDKLTGDPGSLYVCMNGVGIERVECAKGCEVRPSPNDDRCRP